jgi:glycine cleavage system H protein
MIVPKELRYTKDHEWVRVEGDFAVVGITDYAQEKLGSIVFVDLPPAGKSFQKGETLINVDSVKAAAEVYAPLSGEVETLNEQLKENPEAVNQDCYGQGWMIKMKIRNPSELETLLTATAYEAFVVEEEAKE